MLPSNSTEMERALEQSVTRLSSVPVPVGTLFNPETCPSEFLPFLAWALSADRFNYNWDEQQKRDYLRNSVLIHRHKGTLGAVKRALNSLGYSFEIVEWFQKNPRGEPYTFEVRIISSNPDEVTGVMRADFESVVRLAKNMRSHLTGIKIEAGTPAALLYFGALAYSGEVAKITGTSEIELGFPFQGIWDDSVWDVDFGDAEVVFDLNGVIFDEKIYLSYDESGSNGNLYYDIAQNGDSILIQNKNSISSFPYMDKALDLVSDGFDLFGVGFHDYSSEKIIVKRTSGGWVEVLNETSKGIYDYPAGVKAYSRSVFDDATGLIYTVESLKDGSDFILGMSSFDPASGNSSFLSFPQPLIKSIYDPVAVDKGIQKFQVIISGGKIFLFGGNGGAPLAGTRFHINTTFQYEIATDQWSVLNDPRFSSDPAPCPRTDFGFCEFWGYGYVCAGKDENYGLLHDLWRIDLATGQWELVDANIPHYTDWGGIRNVSLLNYKNRFMIRMGGTNGSWTQFIDGYRLY